MRQSILIVDDEPDNLQTLKTLLKVGRYKVYTACDGASCITRVKTIKIDLVLLDVIMPGMPTLEILEKLSNTPVMLVTVLRPSDIQDKGLTQKNVVDYIQKPYDVDDLLMRIEKFFNAGPQPNQRNI